VRRIASHSDSASHNRSVVINTELETTKVSQLPRTGAPRERERERERKRKRCLTVDLKLLEFRARDINISRVLFINCPFTF